MLLVEQGKVSLNDDSAFSLLQTKKVFGGANTSEQVKITVKKEEPKAAAAAPGTLIAPFGKEDTSRELQSHAARTQDTLVDAIENAEVAEIKRSVFRALTRLRAAEIKEFDTIARLETQA